MKGLLVTLAILIPFQWTKENLGRISSLYNYICIVKTPLWLHIERKQEEGRVCCRAENLLTL